MKAKDVLKLLNISRSTLYNYTKNGVIKVTELDNGYYDYDENSVMSIMKKDHRMNVIYSRVSTQKQKNDLVRQTNELIKYCNINNIIVDKTMSEISSGLDLDRIEFNKLFSMVIEYKIKNIYITNKDRLTRLSFKTLKQVFGKFHTKIIIVNDTPHQSNDAEIFEELISLIHIYSTTMYSKRRKEKIDIISKDIKNFLKK